MTNKDDLVRVAGILFELDKDGIYGWYPAGREIQMQGTVLRRLFPGSNYSERHDQVWEPKFEVSVMYEGVKCFALVTREEWDELLAKRTLSDEIVDFVRRMDDLAQQAEAKE